MKRLIITLALLLSPLAALSPAIVHAQTTDVFEDICRTNPEAEVCRDKRASDDDTPTNNAAFGPNGLLTRAAQIVTLIVGIASVVMVMIGGVKYAISGGDPAKTSTAKSAVIYAMVGLFIALMAQSIIIFVLRRL